MNPRSDPQAALLVLVGVVSIQFGAASASRLFSRVGPEGATTLRLVISALLMVVLVRPSLRGHSRGDLAAAAGLGIALAAMNLCFYEAIAHEHLGSADTLAFLGPIGLAIALSRRAWDLLWVVLVGGGITLLGKGGVGALDGRGVAFSLATAVCWAAYLVLASRVARRFQGVGGLVCAMVIAAVAITPFGVVGAGAELVEPGALVGGTVVAVLASVVPYSCEVLALKRLSARTAGLLVGLGPAVAALVGYFVLGQHLGAEQVAGITLVVLASAGVTLNQGRPSAAGPGEKAGTDAADPAVAVVRGPAQSAEAPCQPPRPRDEGNMRRRI